MVNHGVPRFVGPNRWPADLPAFAESQFSFRLSHYPPVAAAPNQFGIAPHTDANFLTFLAQTEVPGLQVRLPAGEWAEVPLGPHIDTVIECLPTCRSAGEAPRFPRPTARYSRWRNERSS